jgi:hypothetical protein
MPSSGFRADGGFVNFIRSKCFHRGLARFCAGVFSIALFTGVMPAQTVNKQGPTAADKEIIKEARQSYYSLKDQGLAAFQCTIVPNWRLLLTEQKLDRAKVDRAAALLNNIHFSISLETGGEAKVTHNEVSAENAEVAKGLNQIYSGMEQMTTGFFQTWSAFSMSPALPEIDGEYQLDKTPTEYRLSYKDGTADIVTLLNRDLATSSLKTTTSEFDSTITPQFKKTAKGLLMTGYEATYKGKSAADTTELQIAIDYQAVDQLQLPQKLDLKGTYGGSPFHVEVTFSGCHATRR